MQIYCFLFRDSITWTVRRPTKKKPFHFLTKYVYVCNNYENKKIENTKTIHKCEIAVKQNLFSSLFIVFKYFTQILVIRDQNLTGTIAQPS